MIKYLLSIKKKLIIHLVLFFLICLCFLGIGTFFRYHLNVNHFDSLGSNYEQFQKKALNNKLGDHYQAVFYKSGCPDCKNLVPQVMTFSQIKGPIKQNIKFYNLEKKNSILLKNGYLINKIPAYVIFSKGNLMGSGVTTPSTIKEKVSFGDYQNSYNVAQPQKKIEWSSISSKIIWIGIFNLLVTALFLAFMLIIIEILIRILTLEISNKVGMVK